MQQVKRCMLNRHPKGFSLVELLIVLAMSALIAVFAVPMVVGMNSSGTGNSKKTAMARDGVLMIFNAYRQYKMVVGTVPTTAKLDDLTPYMSYASVVTSGTLDDRPGFNTAYDCAGGTITCIRLHNGGTFYWTKSHTFGGNSSLNSIWFHFDPDSVFLSTSGADNPSKSAAFFLYYDGKVRQMSQVLPNTITSTGTISAQSDPSWFTGL